MVVMGIARSPGKTSLINDEREERFHPKPPFLFIKLSHLSE